MRPVRSADGQVRVSDVALKKVYETEVVPAMMKIFGYKNRLQVPRVEKVVINMGVGEATQNPDALDSAVADLMQITGQRPVITKAKRSISAFKVRAGMKIGAKVTLRGERMYDFLEKLFYIALPRVRDFKGVSPKGLDGRGNYSLGIKEQVIFPEIDYDKVSKIRGMDVTIVTTAKTDEEAYQLLKLLGMPFSE
ncbi:MAG: 50S ribosomal protein L5 [Firmicutes bacterium]|nr:50S ribosomal protein L5 [Candidatus Fermentithermobacillaceae bacterium]